MQFRVVEHVPSDRVASHVPAKLRQYLPTAYDDRLCTLVIFRFQRDEKQSGVISSSTVRKALSRFEPTAGERLLALAGEFTLESQELLRGSSFEVVMAGDFGWTDESILAIREGK